VVDLNWACAVLTSRRELTPLISNSISFNFMSWKLSTAFMFRNKNEIEKHL
jgi:hypothetical protein